MLFYYDDCYYHTCMYMYMYVYIYIYIYICIHVYIYIYIYTHIHTHMLYMYSFSFKTLGPWICGCGAPSCIMQNTGLCKKALLWRKGLIIVIDNKNLSYSNHTNSKYTTRYCCYLLLLIIIIMIIQITFGKISCQSIRSGGG